MKTVPLLYALAFTIAASSAHGQSPVGTARVLEGPMLGHTTPNTAIVWLRASGPHAVAVEFRPRGAGAWQRTDALRAEPEHDGCVEVHLSGLTPATEYEYRALVNGRPDKYLADDEPARFRTAPSGPARFRLAFGSCARIGEDREQPIWDGVRRAQPDLFCWLGDNIYGDSPDPSVLAEEYRRQRAVRSLQPLLRSVPQLAIWDDHDFGLNDHDRTHPGKAEALEVFGRYWANPSAGTDETAGVFFTTSYGGVDLFFLDVRYHRDPNDAADDGTKTMLGEGQLRWLRRALAASEAPFKVVFSGSGWTRAKGPGGDAWSSFLRERDGLFDWIRDQGITGVVLASGDTHVTEVNCVPWSGRGGYDLYDFVSSPLAQHPTDSWLHRRPELRVRPVWFASPAFGVLDFDLTGDDPTLRHVALDAQGREVTEPVVLAASQLRNGVASWPRAIDPDCMRAAERDRAGQGYYTPGRLLTLPTSGLGTWLRPGEGPSRTDPSDAIVGVGSEATADVASGEPAWLEALPRDRWLALRVRASGFAPLLRAVERHSRLGQCLFVVDDVDALDRVRAAEPAARVLLACDTVDALDAARAQRVAGVLVAADRVEEWAPWLAHLRRDGALVVATGAADACDASVGKGAHFALVERR